MSLSCIHGGKECDGCMECQDKISFIHCDICGIEIHDVYYDINDDIICEECLDELYRKYI